MCSDCEAYRLKYHGLTWSDCIIIWYIVYDKFSRCIYHIKSNEKKKVWQCSRTWNHNWYQYRKSELGPPALTHDPHILSCLFILGHENLPLNPKTTPKLADNIVVYWLDNCVHHASHHSSYVPLCLYSALLQGPLQGQHPLPLTHQEGGGRMATPPAHIWDNIWSLI